MSGGVEYGVVNLEAVTAALAALGPEIMAVAAHAAEVEAEYEFGLTQLRVPVDTAELQKSGRVVGVDVSADALIVGIAYGGPPGIAENTIDVDYALQVHEDLETQHKDGRTAKYVENPVREELESGRAAARMGAMIKAEMGLL